jgi:hypothetical protein
VLTAGALGEVAGLLAAGLVAALFIAWIRWRRHQEARPRVGNRP